VIDHEIDDDANSTLLGGVRELDKVAERAVARVDIIVVRNVIAVVAGPARSGKA
jgi:hypothetical protein